MKWIPVTIKCHAGYKPDEYPKCFYLNNTRYEIVEISDRWYQSENRGGMPNADYFNVFVKQGEHYILKHDLEQDV